MPVLITQVIQLVATLFGLAGVLLVVWGGIIAIIELLRVELIDRGKDRKKLVERLRVDFGQKIVLGLEFFLAGDLLRLIETPTIDHLIRLGGLVFIRTTLAYFLSKEIDKHK